MKAKSSGGATIFYLVCFHTVLSLENINFAFNYFNLRHKNSLSVFLCQNYDVNAVLPSILPHRREYPFFSTVKTPKILLERGVADDIFLAQPVVTGIIIDLDCPSSWSVLDQFSQKWLFNGSYAFALVSQLPLEQIISSLETLRIAFDSDVVIFSGERIYDVYRTAYGRPFIRSVIGCCLPDGQVVMTPKPRRTDLQGITLRATTVVEFFKKGYGTPDWANHWLESWRDVMSRTPCQLHKSIEQYANFKTVMYTAPTWGYYNASAEWSHGFNKGSMFGQLGDNLTDFGLALSWMWSKRMHTAYFAPPTHNFKAYAVFRHPPASSSYNAFARPFAWSTWVVIWGFMLIGSGCLFAAMQLSEREVHPSELTYGLCIFAVTGLICLKSTLVEGVQMIPTRVVIVFLQLLAFMVYTYYGTTILGFLLSPSPRTITSLEKLLDSGISLWMENTTFSRPLIKAGLSTKATKYYVEAIKGPTEDQDKVISRHDGLKLVQRGGAAFYGFTPILFENIKEIFSSPEICSLYYLELLKFSGASAIQKQSPFKEMYTKATLWLMECGLNNYDKIHWMPGKPPCVGQEINPAIGLEATFIGQIIYLAGFAMSLIFFALEKAIASKKKSNQIKMDLQA